MSSKFRHIQIKHDDTKKNRNHGSLKQNNLGKSNINKKSIVDSTNNNKNAKINKSLEIDEKRIKKKNKDINESYDANENKIRYNSQARRKINKDKDNSKKKISSSYEKRIINKKKNNDDFEIKNKKIKKVIKIKTKRNCNNEINEEEKNFKRDVKKTKIELSKQNLKPIKNKELNKSTQKNIQSEKTDKSNFIIDLKINKFKKEEKEIKNRNGKKLLTNGGRTITSRIIKKKSKKDEEYICGQKKRKSSKNIFGKCVGEINNKKIINKEVKKSLLTKKMKKKEDIESQSESDSESKSESEKDKSSKSSKSPTSRNSKSSKSSQSSKKSASISNRTSSSPTPSSDGTNSGDEEKEKHKLADKTVEFLKTFNKSKTSVDKPNTKLEDENKFNQNQKVSGKDKQKDQNQQILNNIPKFSTDGRKGSIILGSQYLRRRSMDNPFTRERLELLVNQMTLKQNGGNTLFLKNYENGPSYNKDITFITKDSKSIKRHIKINECTKAGCSGPGIVKTNQDAYFVKENFLKNNECYFIGVCDGHGEQGHVISNYVINKLPAYIKDLSSGSITEAFKKINKEIYSSNKMDSNMSGTTVVSVILTPNNIICVNLGDSRASLFRYENGLYYCRNLSRDHKPSEPDESKRIVNNGGRVKKCYDEEHKRFIGPDRVWMKNKEEPGLAMTRSLGDKIAHNIGVIDEPEFKTFTYDGTEKFIILASDGLWEYVNGDQCINIVKPFYEESKDSKEAVLALTKEAFKKWKRKEVAIDDITVILIFFD
jgi:serine/threonine protein phosphatase PrpC